MKEITIRKYGARLIGDNEATIVQSMRDQNNLWNKLVEIERSNRTEYREIVTQSDDELAALSNEANTAEQRLEEVQAQRARARAAKRSKQIEGAADYAAEIKALSATLKSLRAKMKERRAYAKEVARPRLDTLELRRRAAIKEAAKDAALWWPHSELVLGAFDVARARALKSNADLLFHRFKGEGRIGVRFSPGLLLGAPTATELLKVRDALPEELNGLSAVRAKKRILAVDMRIGKPDDAGVIPVATFLITVHAGKELRPDETLWPNSRLVRV